MKFIVLIILSTLCFRVDAQNDNLKSFESEIWVCFSGEENVAKIIGRDTINLISYEFARHVSNLNYHATILPKIQFMINGDLKIGTKVDQDSLINVPEYNWKWSYSNNAKTKLIISSSGQQYQYKLEHIENKFLMIRISN
ncbi:MAG: hypothetical protein HRT69_13125 [Flavobacteriaceae bacterium]|nr:hypothetical protein [Flavobacteriaceae bacterium]